MHLKNTIALGAPQKYTGCCFSIIFGLIDTEAVEVEMLVVLFLWVNMVVGHLTYSTPYAGAGIIHNLKKMTLSSGKEGTGSGGGGA